MALWRRRAAAWLSAVSCLAAGAVAAGCAGAGERPGNARDGGSIVFGLTEVPQVLDPALATDGRALQALRLVYTPLLSYRHASGGDGTELTPGLARALPEVSEDGLTYTLELRRGLRYSNGAPVRASDFERALSRVRALGSPLAPLYETVAAIEAGPRSRRIRITLNRPDPAFAHVLALPSSAPLPRGAATDLSARPPPGMGPYRIRAVRPGRRVALSRVRGFELAGVPSGHVDSIALVRRESPAEIASEMVAGSLDVSQQAPPRDLRPEVRTKYRDHYSEELAATTVVLVPNFTPPLDDPAVRRALGTALDGPRLARLYDGLLEPSCNVIPEAVQGYRRLDPCPLGDLDEPPDLVAARSGIEEAGAVGSLVRVRAAVGVPPAVARYVVRALRKIGLTASSTGARGATLAIERIAPGIGHPAAFVEPLAEGTFDEELSGALADATLARGEDAEEIWAAADERIVSQGYAIPVGQERRPSFLSDRIDVDTCAVINPLFGVDLASLCLK